VLFSIFMLMSVLTQAYRTTRIPKADRIPFEEDRPLGPITKQLAGIIKINDDLNYEELLTNALTEKYL